jgi:hypothetical protein
MIMSANVRTGQLLYMFAIEFSGARSYQKIEAMSQIC